MMEYERLTDKQHRYKKCVGCKYRNCQYCDDDIKYAEEVHNRLAELEDKIEQGTLKEERTCVYQEYNDGDWSYWECSNCEEPFCFNNECTPEENQYHYCPNCGARITEYKELQNG